jgi:ubiquinone/menaquinone biosynthesis C-methylase UbiE
VKRTVIPELLDSDSGTPGEIATSLSDLRRVNQWFGGVSATESMIVRVARRVGSESLSLLEIAAGAGHVPQAVCARLHDRGTQLEVTLLDRAISHLNHRRQNGTLAVAGDALALPFAASSFDLVGSCLFAHHLTPLQLAQFVNEGLRVCRHAVLINDLVRSPLHLALVYAGYPLYRSRITRHDAPASVRQAYTPEEMKQMLRQTSAARVEIQRHYLFRMGVIAWKAGPGV